MEEKIMKLRLDAVAKALGISSSKLGVSIGRSTGYVNSLKDGISTADLSKIIEAYPAVNLNYILSGKGSPIREDVDTLTELQDIYEPEADDYRELCMAYRADLADTREDLRRQREAYFALMEVNNKLFAELARIQAVCLAAGLKIVDRDNNETK